MCGDMGGKVLVSSSEHILRLISFRWQAGFLNSPLFVIARTGAEAATLLDSIFDPIDYPHIMGATVQGVETLCEATQQGKGDSWKTCGLQGLP